MTSGRIKQKWHNHGILHDGIARNRPLGPRRGIWKYAKPLGWSEREEAAKAVYEARYNL